jgi:hypothetical protein
MMFWDNQQAVQAAGLDGSPMDEGEESADSLVSYLEERIDCVADAEYGTSYTAFVESLRRG